LTGVLSGKCAGFTAVVTGVSSGIGRELARHLLGRGARVFGSVRSDRDADLVGAEMGERFTPLVFDLTDADAIARAAAQVGESLGGDRLGALVNNAGLAHFGPLALQPIDDWRENVEVNLIGTLRVIQAFLPLLGTDPRRAGPPGRIVNISSVSGRVALPFLSGYAAAKHGLEALSDCMRRELAMYGIRTIVIQPGSVATPIWDKLRRADRPGYVGTDYGPLFERFQSVFAAGGEKAHGPETIARLVGTILTAPRPRPRYALVSRRLAHWTLPRLLPDWLVDRIACRHFRLPEQPGPLGREG
jgi:NAD(P)-dependent dehydrogenase (short-subunit alcohol dehydrogenase family)